MRFFLIILLFLTSSICDAGGLTVTSIVGLDRSPLFVETPISITMRNEGKELVVVESTETDCYCLQLANEPFVLEPGEGKTIQGTFHGLELGPYKRSLMLKVEYENGRSDKIMEEISGIVTLPPSKHFVSQDVIKKDPNNYKIYDLRNSGLFMRYRIAGSEHIGTKFLPPIDQQDKIVLVSEGYPTPRVIQFAEKMRNQTGADVFYLEGGLSAWASAGLPLVGFAVRDPGSVFVPANQVLSLIKAKPILWLHGARNEKALSVGSFEIRYWDDYGSADISLSERPHFLVALSDQESFRLARELPDTAMPPIVKGGLPGVLAALETQQRLRESQRNASVEVITLESNGSSRTLQSLKTLPGCGTCPK